MIEVLTKFIAVHGEDEPKKEEDKKASKGEETISLKMTSVKERTNKRCK